MSNLKSVCLYARPPNMTSFWVKNSSRTSIWLNVSLCTNYVTSIFFIESKYFVFADWRMPSSIKYAAWIQLSVVIPTYVRSLKLVHCYLLQKAWQNITVMTYKRIHRIKKIFPRLSPPGAWNILINGFIFLVQVENGALRWHTEARCKLDKWYV